MVYNANNIGAIDLSAYISALGSLNVGDAVDVNGDSRLKKLVLGDGTNTNAYLTAISGLNAIKGLEEIDIRGYQAITSMDLSALTNLTTFKATGSGLTGFAPAAGIALTAVELPSTLQTLSLNGANVTAITYTPTTALRSVSLRTVSGAWDAKGFVNTWLNLLSAEQIAAAELTLTGVNWTGMTAAQVLKIGAVGTKTLQGKVTLSSITQSEYTQLVEVFGVSVFQPDSAFIIDAPDTVLLSGPTSLMEGGSGSYSATAFPVSSNSFKYLLYNGTTLIESQTDQLGNVYRTYGGVTLYEATGAISVNAIIGSNITLKVRANIDGTETYSDFITVSVEKYTYPSAVTIDGSASIDSNGLKNYGKTLSGTYNATVTGVEWRVSENNACSIHNSTTDNTLVLQVTNTPATALEVTLTCIVTFNTGVTMTGTKTVTLQLTFPTSVSISGDDTITAAGSKSYTISFNPSAYTASLLEVLWDITSDSHVSVSGNNSGATVTLSENDGVTRTLTLSCTARFSGDVTRSATKSITFKFPPEGAVDLGLPSGLLWRNRNVGANSETDYGDYFSWGNITGHKSTNGSTFDDGYDFGTSNSGPYASTPGKSLTGNIASNDSAHDAALANLGSGWHMPTKENFKELYDNTDNEWTTINGVAGRKFMKKSDHSVYVFFPAAGYGYGTSLDYRGSRGFYWSASFYDSDYAFYLIFNSSDVYPQNYNYRYLGFSVRAVQ